MGGGLPKALRPLGGKPLFLHSLVTLQQVSGITEIVIVAPGDALDSFLAALEGHSQEQPRLRVVAGGAERADSVAAGLAASDPSNELVLVHDAARPFVTRAAVEACVRGARSHGSAILAIPVTDTIKWVEAGVIHHTVDRSCLWHAQTPQVSRRDWLVTAIAHAQTCGLQATDEAQLLEAAGFPVHVVPGEETNRKLTRPDDWDWAEWYAARSRAGSTSSENSRIREQSPR